MNKYSGNDPYLDPASGVLKNRFGLTNEAALEKREASEVATLCYELAQKPLN
jgi:cell filamentation protein